MKAPLSFLLVPLLAIFSCGNVSQPSNKLPLPETGANAYILLDSLLKNVMDTGNIPGLAIAITIEDSVYYVKAFGLKSLITKEPLRPEHVFHTASLSKPLAATAIVKLVEQGKIDLGEKVTTYLPYFRLADPRYKEITILQILNHTSGMPDVKDYQWDKPQLDKSASERYVRSLTGEKMLADPGKEFHYSNMAFDVLADVVAKVTGQTFEDYVNEYLLHPLKMTESSFYQPDIKPELRTSPHTGKPPIVSKIYPYNRRHAPSSTLNSNVLDMAHLLIADLNNGAYKGTQVLKTESHNLLMKPSFTIDKEKGYTVGLSWFLGPYKDRLQIVIHSGLDLGYSSFLTMVPEKKLGIVILSNYDQTPVEAINFKVLDIVLAEMDKQVSIQKH